jgi:hypothetical protein
LEEGDQNVVNSERFFLDLKFDTGECPRKQTGSSPDGGCKNRARDLSFRRQKACWWAATITLQFSQHAVSLLNHATLSFNLLSGLTLEQAQKIAETLTENVLDASVEVSSEHPMFVG